MLKIYFSINRKVLRYIPLKTRVVLKSKLPKSICIFSKVKETVSFMPNKIYSFTSDFNWRATFVTNAIQIAFPFLIKWWPLLCCSFKVAWNFCRKYDFWRRAEGTTRWRKLTRPSLEISNPISVKFLTDTMRRENFLASPRVKSSKPSYHPRKSELALRYRHEGEVSLHTTATSKKFRIPDHRSVSGKLGSRA